MSQLAAPRDGITKERAWPFAIVTSLWVAGVFILSSLIIGLALGLFDLAGLKISSDTNVENAVASALVFVLVVAILLGGPRLLKLWSGRISYRRLLGLSRHLWWRDILFGLIGFAVYFAILLAVMALVTALVPGFNADQAQDLGFSNVLSRQNAIIVFISLVVIPPIVEEIVFRGYLFGTLRRSVPVWAAALVTSLLFGLAHLQWNVGIDVFVMSLVSCFLRYKTGALWASIILHMVKNGLAFYVLYIASRAIM